VQPNTDQFLENARDAIQVYGGYFPSPEARFLPMMIAGQPMQWMGTKWYGPIDGALFVLDCAGTRAAALRIGGVVSLRPGPVLPVGQTAEVVYVSGTGSGVYQTSVALVALEASSIKILWKHEAEDREAFASAGYDYVDQFRWKVGNNGRTITVNGRRMVGEAREKEHGWAARTNHSLPQERYCWDADEKLFQQCKSRAGETGQ
jgi:hypothetical protein